MAQLAHTRFGLPPFTENVIVVFGYGSLLWKQNFEFTHALDCYVKGYRRTFYQGSRDHRGVPGKPGRVATLLPAANPEERVYGKAFVLPADPEKLATILEALDVREQGGYVREELPLFDAHAGEEEVELDIRAKAQGNTAWLQHIAGKGVVNLCYIATEDNEDYLGEAPIDEMARQIVDSVGPSGTNVEYLLLLAEHLHAMGAEDRHVYTLAELAQQMMAEDTEVRADPIAAAVGM